MENGAGGGETRPAGRGSVLVQGQKAAFGVDPISCYRRVRWSTGMLVSPPLFSMQMQRERDK